MNWLNQILKENEELEAPLSFWKWSALAALSAVVKDHVYWDKFRYRVYPNIYVLLHADSGLKKGAPISMANRLVKSVNNTNIIEGRASIQGILKFLGDKGQARTQPGGKIVESNMSAFLCWSEFTSSIVDDPAAMDILTDLFDRHYRVGEWTSLLKQEQFSLTTPIVTMLAGTNSAHLEAFFKKKDMQGGYFARTFIIHETKRNRVNSLMFPPTVVSDEKGSIEYLKKLAVLRGPFIIEDRTRREFDSWYKSFCSSRDMQEASDPTGTLNRFDDSVLKVAMLRSLATVPTLELQHDCVMEALNDCEKLVGNVRTATMGKHVESAWSVHKTLLLKELLGREPHSITFTQLIKKYYLHANDNEWSQVINTMVAAGYVKMDNAGGQMMITMPDKVVDEFKKHLEGK